MRSNLGSRVVTLRGARKCVILRLRQIEKGSRVREKKHVKCNYSSVLIPGLGLNAVRVEARKAIFTHTRQFNVETRLAQTTLPSFIAANAPA